MARPAFKKIWTRLIPNWAERSTYVLASSVCLIVLFWLWQPQTSLIWEVNHAMAVAVIWFLFGLGWSMVLISTFLIDHFDLFGLRQVYCYSSDRVYVPNTFRTPFLYRMVRHPIMLGFIIAFWATPTMTAGHLLFAGMTTAYILVGVCLEERDLSSSLGQAYKEYRTRTGMLFPRWPSS